MADLDPVPGPTAVAGNGQRKMLTVSTRSVRVTFEAALAWASGPALAQHGHGHGGGHSGGHAEGGHGGGGESHWSGGGSWGGYGYRGFYGGYPWFLGGFYGGYPWYGGWGRYP
jgi:hypothetical protein